jgi:hypothetical protein
LSHFVDNPFDKIRCNAAGAFKFALCLPLPGAGSLNFEYIKYTTKKRITAGIFPFVMPIMIPDAGRMLEKI